MAISKEDNHDVAKHLGKALAKKVAKVTDDSKMKKSFGFPQGSAAAAIARKEAGRSVKLTPTVRSGATTYFASSEPKTYMRKRMDKQVELANKNYSKEELKGKYKPGKEAKKVTRDGESYWI